MIGVTLAVVAQLAGESRQTGSSGHELSATYLKANNGGSTTHSRFVPVVVLPHGELDEPMAFDLARDGRIYIIERKGTVKAKYPGEQDTRTIARVPVNTKYREAGAVRESQEGLLGIALDPNFANNGWIYLLYAPEDAPEHVLARWQLSGDRVVPHSEQVLLRYAVDRDVCCHFGGGMTWDASGNLYIAVGSNTGEPLIRGAFQFTPSDERTGRSSWDAQRTASNTNDLRGKILRIHPMPDGTYSIPPGNLFPPGDIETRPEIFTMGHRNPWHPTIDSKTGWLYWGEVGPDRLDVTSATPAGFDELNRAKEPGFFGWPYFIGFNRPYAIADLVNNRFGLFKDVNRPANDSVNNTGRRYLPPAQPALIAYGIESDPKWPALGSGGSCAMGGPIYRRSGLNPSSNHKWPQQYEGKWIVTDCSRRWILSIGMDPTGNPLSIEPLGVDYRPMIPVDMKIDLQGDLYVLEYGSSMLGKAPDAQLVRIEYAGGNRNPVAVASADKIAGRAPLTVRLTGAGSLDPDSDQLRFEWQIRKQDGSIIARFRQRDSVVTIPTAGVYAATLTVKDSAGASGSASVMLACGNEPPSVQADMHSTSGGNTSFFTPGAPIQYRVRIMDAEDGGDIKTPDPDSLSLSVDDVGDEVNLNDLLSTRSTESKAAAVSGVARALMIANNCTYCHANQEPSRGPSLAQLSTRYGTAPAVVQKLVARVRQGGDNVWGSVSMPVFSRMSPQTAATIVKYMVRGAAVTHPPSLLQGSYLPGDAGGDPRNSVVVLRATYTDRGVGAIPPQTSTAVAIMRPPRLIPARADIRVNATIQGDSISAGTDSHIGFEAIDLSGITSVAVSALAMSGESGSQESSRRIELRVDSPTGELVGAATVDRTSAVSDESKRPFSNAETRPEPKEPTGQVLANTGNRPVAGPLDLMSLSALRPAGPSTPPRPTIIAVTPVEGKHTLYLVFRGGRHARLIVGQIAVSFAKSDPKGSR